MLSIRASGLSRMARNHIHFSSKAFGLLIKPTYPLAVCYLHRTFAQEKPSPECDQTAIFSFMLTLHGNYTFNLFSHILEHKEIWLSIIRLKHYSSVDLFILAPKTVVCMMEYPSSFQTTKWVWTDPCRNTLIFYIFEISLVPMYYLQCCRFLF